MLAIFMPGNSDRNMANKSDSKTLYNLYSCLLLFEKELNVDFPLKLFSDKNILPFDILR